MANRTRFSGTYNAFSYFYGGPGSTTPGALRITTGNTAAGSASVTLALGQTTLSDGTNLSPLNINAPITVGDGSNAETVTPSAVSVSTPGIYNSSTVTATFSNIHGGDSISSGTCGLQEAINAAAAAGGGTVVIDGDWWANGGTLAIVQAAVVPQIAQASLATPTVPLAASVRIFDQTTLQYYEYKGNSVSLLAAPSIPLITQVASTSTTGTWTAVTTYVKFVYVNAIGGLSAASSEYSFTATVGKAIGGTGPIAATGAVGYLVFIGTTTNVNYQVAVTTSSGTPIRCGAFSAFKIGTSFSSVAITTSATALPPTLASASATLAMQPISAPNMIQPFQTVYPPFAAVATVTAGTASEVARFDTPTAFLDQIGRCIRITAWFSFTPGSTATLIPLLKIQSVYGTTTTTVWTVTTAATSGTTQSNGKIVIELVTAATGASGTLEAHGLMNYQSATGSAPAMLAVGDSVTAASGAINLAGQNTFVLQMNSGTANLTDVRVRSLIVEVLN